MTIQGVVVHCSDSPQGRGDTASTIHSWHKARGWDGIGYHYVILEDGTIENGRPLYWIGAHASGYNHYVGICLIGIDDFTDAQYAALEALLKELMSISELKQENIVGHNQVSLKSCPGFDVTTFTERAFGKQNIT